VTSTNVTDAVPQRASVQATLDTILNDVLLAATYLPATNINRYRVTKYAAYGLLSRICLYRADYPNAQKYAEMALAAPHTYLDYNQYASASTLPVTDLNPEILWQRASTDPVAPVGANYSQYSDDLKTYFADSANDLRYTLLSSSNPSTGRYRSSVPGRANVGITFQEMDLTRAEVIARSGDSAGAMAVVNNLRKFRIRTAGYTMLTASSTGDALLKVLAERRRELAYGGLRWWDMKRLDRAGEMPPVNRIDMTTGDVDGVLQPHSPAYTFQIPLRVLQFNPDMKKN
jgi:hypothetical protein